ncbi:MAG: T9SS type A sorting domain-containing protein, partial [Paludibacteraceae bacterium]
MVIFFTMPGKTFAGENDTLIVYANGASLDQIINSDTTTNGMQAHGAYKLVSLDTTYLYLGPITVKSNFTVIGVLGPDGRPPCIQPGTLSDGSMPSVLFVINGTGTIATFKNFYIFELSINNSWDWGKDFIISADSVKFYLDNVIVDENRGEVIAYTGMHDDFFITNCKFRNGVYPSNWFSSIILTADWPTSNPADSIVMKYNTMFCVNSCAVSPGSSAPLSYLDFSHNSIVYSFTQPLNIATVFSAKIDNNIFYGVNAAGGADKLFLSKVGSVIALDTINADTDLARTVEVKNNIYFQPKAITDFWTAWNDTSTTDSIFVPTWMNAQTSRMFSDSEKTLWPGFVQSGNLVNVDPQYGTSLQSVTNNTASGPTVGLLQYVTEVKNGTISTDDWGYQQQSVTGNNWIPAWPLTEQTTSALKYSAPLTAPDGKPYGDPYWFTLASNPNNLTVISNSHTYTVSASPSSNYPDANGTKLTDGKFASTAYYADPAWVGFSSPDTLNVVIDLNNTMPVQQFMGEYLLDPQPAINLPNQVYVSVSTDNSTFTKIGTMNDSAPNDTLSSIHKYYYTLSNPVNARYVKFSTVAPGGAWVFVDEYQVLSSSPTGVKQQTTLAPTKFDLSNNYPNPFNPSTNIRFSLAQSGIVSLRIYNIMGQLVKTIVDNIYKNKGDYNYQVTLDNLSSGVYFYSLIQGNQQITKKMILLK